ncbi:MAG TPA: S8 family serine peptidase [Blastocatellia bacterium]|nr:S8 family serine peptidase [Blastocatellia bacterium]
MDYAAAHGASVINCSFGTEGYSQALLDAIDRAAASGVLVVASAGNQGADLAHTPYYPASYNLGNLIAVAASTNTDQLAEFSNWGADHVQIAAPGVEIVTTSAGGGYLRLTGTSAAAPLVAGVAGLLKTLRGWVSAQTVKQSLIDGARRSDSLSGRVSSGGVLSAGNAIAALMSSLAGPPAGSGGEPSETKGGSSGLIDLDQLRLNRPGQAEPRVAVNLPPEGWTPPDRPEDPGSHLAASRPASETGRSASKVGREGDPTIGAGSTGGQSISLGSQNINLTLPVLSLAGRGPGLNLALSYNSNSVWLKEPWLGRLGFNLDRGLPGPGWSLGFGKLQGGAPASGSASIPPLWHSNLGKYAYLWFEPDGTCRLLVGTASAANRIYRSNDSSHLEYDLATGILWQSDGTQIRFTAPADSGGAATGKELLPREIKDRNGNFISIVNAPLSDGRWAIDYLTDTLGRTIDFAYENNVLTQVRQNRAGAWHVFVKFHYAPVTINTNFGGQLLEPVGINGQTVWEPWLIEFPGLVNYRIFYTSYCQAYQIEKWAPAIPGQGAERPLAETWYDLPSINGQSLPEGPPRGPASDNTAQTDCPKFATREEWAENWSRSEPGWVTGGVYQWARYDYHLFSDSGGTHIRITDPIGRIHRTDVSPDNLTHLSRVWADSSAYGSDANPGAPLKATTTIYEQAPDGPRVRDQIITDGPNTRKTGINYWTQVWVSLPDDLKEYQHDGSTVYRHRRIFYNTNPIYTDRHLFGVIDQEFVCQGDAGGTKVSGKGYAYDEPASFDTSPYLVAQHDSVNYGPGLVAGRGNVTTVSQYDAQTGVWRVVARSTYGQTGTVLAVADAAGYATLYSYVDNFSSSPAGPTYALPTRIRDQDGYWSGVRYDWYTGLPVENYHLGGTGGNGPRENVVTRVYDDLDRLVEINQPPGHGGQTTYLYWDNWLVTGVFRKIDGEKRSYRATSYDGAGRVRWQSGDHPDGPGGPDGVGGKFWMRRFAYDAVGREIGRSNSIAVDANSEPIDDDAAQGWLYTATAYDALDRQRVITRPDGNAIRYDYSGCGCAGNSAITVTDERGRRRRTVYDFLGRLKEAHQLSAGGSIYSRAVYFYDARDLPTKIEHYDGGGSHQDRISNYDGFGRLQSRTTPEAGTITYGYQANDRLDYVEDERIVGGSTRSRATFNYNGRGHLTEILYNDHDSTPDVYFEYGDYGERTWIREKNDAGTTLGSTQYTYDPYQRLQSETRRFNGLDGIFRVSYRYNQADAVKQMTYQVNGWEKNVYYEYSSGGELIKLGSDLTGGAVTENIAKDFNYRAFQGLKNVTYGNGRRLEVDYHQKRQQLARLRLLKADGSDPVLDLSYNYDLGGDREPAGNNGRIREVIDHLDGSFSAGFGYDDYNRLVYYGPNNHRSYAYDPWGNLEQVGSSVGAGEAPNYRLTYAANSSGAPLSNRIHNPGYSYDAAGNLTSDGEQQFTYDAANRLKTATGGTSSQEYDGLGNRVQHRNSAGALYYLWSSVLGQPVVEIAASDAPYVYRAYVYSPGGQMIALQSYEGGFYWSHGDQLGSGKRLTDLNGAVVYRAEYDPHGQLLYEWGSGGATYRNSHKFTGYERDWATNLDQAKARTYHHNRGRFMQPDPLGLMASDLSDPQSLNLYSYVQNDPVNFTDPTGLFRWRDPRLDDTRINSLLFDFVFVTYIKGGGGPGRSGRGGASPRQIRGQDQAPETKSDFFKELERKRKLEECLKQAQAEFDQAMNEMERTYNAKIRGAIRDMNPFTPMNMAENAGGTALSLLFEALTKGTVSIGGGAIGFSLSMGGKTLVHLLRADYYVMVKEHLRWDVLEPQYWEQNKGCHEKYGN